MVLFINILLILILYATKTTQNSTTEGKHFDLLEEGEQKLLTYLKRFSVNSRPVKNSSSAVKVNVTMEMVRLDAVSEKGQSLKMKLHVNYNWWNHYLVWEPSQYKGVKEVIIPEDEIWTPPVQLYNEASQSPGEHDKKTNRRLVLLSYNGTCSLTDAKYFKSTCEINVSDFPFDEQFCDLTFGSWSMDENLLSLYAKNTVAIADGLYKENGEWELARAILKTQTVKYPIHRRRHSTIKLEILIRRKYFFFLMTLVVPCALIASLIFLVFVLPPKSGERISLGITVMFSMAIFQELSSAKLPSSSDNYPLLGIYFTTSMFEIGTALALNCFILNIFYRDYEMAPWIRRLLFDKLARAVRITIPYTRTQHYLDKAKYEQHRYELGLLSESTSNDIDNNADADNGTTNGKMESIYFPNTKQQRGETQQHVLNNRKKKNSINLGEGDMSYKKTPVPNIISLLSKPTVRIDERKLLSSDWQTVARILDRIMLILATFVGIVSAVTIFLQAKRFRQMLSM